MNRDLLILLGIGAVVLYLMSDDNDASATTYFSPDAPMDTTNTPAQSPMTASDSEIAYIKRKEGLKLTAYRDANGYSIGYGHFGASAGQTISQGQADSYFQSDIQTVENCINSNVTVALSQNQFDALCDLIFNIGVNAFAGSTLLRKLNAGDYAGASAEFARWNKSSGTVNQDLVARRQDETNLFNA